MLSQDVEKGVLVDGDFGGGIYPLGEFAFVVELDGIPFRLELFIVDERLEFSQFIHVQHPLVCL